VEVHCVLIEYENEKDKRAHYLVQIIDYYDPYDQWHESVLDRWEIFTYPTLATMIGL